MKSDSLEVHIAPGISLPVPIRDIPAILKTIEEEGVMIEKILSASTLNGGRRRTATDGDGRRKKIRIPLYCGNEEIKS